MSNDKQIKTIPIPQRLFENMIEAHRKWESFSGEFEDFLLASDKKFIEKMRNVRKEHLKGRTKGIKILRQELR